MAQSLVWGQICSCAPIALASASVEGAGLPLAPQGSGDKGTDGLALRPQNSPEPLGGRQDSDKITLGLVICPLETGREALGGRVS